MDRPKAHSKQKPETKLQQAIEDYMTLRGWFTKNTVGSAFSAGWPDFFACHHKYGQRWVEVKMPTRRGNVFTVDQHAVFPQLMANGSGVWVLVAASEHEYEKLFRKPNWWQYLI